VKEIEIQQYYHSGLKIEEISTLTGVKSDTIKKAVRQKVGMKLFFR